MTRPLLADIDLPNLSMVAPKEDRPTPGALVELLILLRDALAEADPPRPHICGTGWRLYGGRDRSTAPECCWDAARAYRRSQYRRSVTTAST